MSVKFVPIKSHVVLLVGGNFRHGNGRWVTSFYSSITVVKRPFYSSVIVKAQDSLTNIVS